MSLYDDYDPFEGAPPSVGETRRRVLRNRQMSSVTNNPSAYQDKPVPRPMPQQPPQQPMPPQPQQQPMPQTMMGPQQGMENQPMRQEPPMDWLTRNRMEQERLRGQLGGLEAEPDLGPLQQAAKAQREGGNRQLMLALAAQQAGQDYAPLQAHFLKQAAQAQSPTKFTGGYIDDQGNVVRDPFYAQEQKRKLIEQQLSGLSDQERKHLEAQLKIEQDKRQDAMLEAYRRESLGIRRDAAGRAGDAAEDRKSAANARDENALSKQFDSVTANYREELNATGKLKQLAPDLIGRRPNAIEQQSMIILLNKFLDPGSVVREGEFDRVARAQGFIERAGNFKHRILHGELMDDTLITQLVEMASFYETAARAKIQSIGKQYEDKSVRRGLDPRNVILDPNYNWTPPAAAPGVTVREKGAAPPAATPVVAPPAIPPEIKVREKPRN